MNQLGCNDTETAANRTYTKSPGYIKFPSPPNLTFIIVAEKKGGGGVSISEASHVIKFKMVLI